MRTVTYQTVGRRVDLTFDGLSEVRVLVDGVVIAYYGLEYVWDLMKDVLQNIEPGDSPGLKRRKYEALSTMDATQKFIDQENKK